MDETLFGVRLKELRVQSGLTQKELAERAGVAQRTVSGLEQSAYEPVWSTVLKLAAALGVRLEEFLVESASTPEPRRGRPPKGGAARAEVARKGRARNPRPRR